MTAQKDHITAALVEIGACWAVTQNKCVLPDDPLEDQAAGRRTYHIHPDASEPHVRYIQRFDSLKELEAWIREQRPLRRRPDAPQCGKPTLVYLPTGQKRELRHRYGSTQAAIEKMVERELGRCLTCATRASGQSRG